MTRLAAFLLLSCMVCAGARATEIRLAGQPEIYLSHTEMTCPSARGVTGIDVADMPVTAFRRKDATVVVMAGNQQNFVLEGRSVDTARRVSCDSLVVPANDPDPEDFNARRWLFAIYAKSYDLVLGFVHNEYHGGDFFPDECRKTTQYNFECWYGATTLVTSSDGGFTFTTPAPPDNVLASPPSRFETGKRRLGAFSPKIVANPHDSLVYVMIHYLDVSRKLNIGQCLLRGSGTKLNDWKAWDGRSFALDMESPYAVARGEDCKPVLPYLISSLKYIPAIDQFVALGNRRNTVIYSFSSDLTAWSRPQELMTIERIQEWKPGDEPARDYFSFLDPDSSSINFDTLEKRPYLYFVQFGTDAKEFLRTRDVYRQRIEIK